MSSSPDKKNAPAGESESVELSDLTTFHSVNGADIGFENKKPVPLVDGIKATEFDEPEPSEIESQWTAAEQRTNRLWRAALARYFGFDARSLRRIASDEGVSPEAVSNHWRRVLEVFDRRQLYAKGEKRLKLKRAAARNWAKKKAAA